MDQTPPLVLLIGDPSHREFHAAVAWLHKTTRLTCVPTVEAALRRAGEDSRTWQTVVLAQARPGNFSTRDVERLGGAFPLSRFVALLGSLCEGEPRSGRPWPGVTRIYWHQWPVRCATELGIGDRAINCHLPRTASEVERLESYFHRPPSPAAGLVMVLTRSALLFDALAAACRLAGYSCVWSMETHRRSCIGAVAAIWDGSTHGNVDFDRLQRVTGQLAGVPVLALLGFPRYDQYQRALQCGAHGILSTPFLLPDLWEALRQATSRDARDQPLACGGNTLRGNATQGGLGSEG